MQTSCMVALDGKDHGNKRSKSEKKPSYAHAIMITKRPGKVKPYRISCVWEVPTYQNINMVIISNKMTVRQDMFMHLPLDVLEYHLINARTAHMVFCRVQGDPMALGGLLPLSQVVPEIDIVLIINVSVFQFAGIILIKDSLAIESVHAGDQL